MPFCLRRTGNNQVAYYHCRKHGKVVWLPAGHVRLPNSKQFGRREITVWANERTVMRYLEKNAYLKTAATDIVDIRNL